MLSLLDDSPTDRLPPRSPTLFGAIVFPFCFLYKRVMIHDSHILAVNLPTVRPHLKGALLDLDLSTA